MDHKQIAILEQLTALRSTCFTNPASQLSSGFDVQRQTVISSLLVSQIMTEK